MSRDWKHVLPVAAALVVLVVGILLLAGCATAPQFVDRPVVTEVEHRVYVEIPRDLCAEQPIATGPVSESPRVANERRAALERANANARAVCAVQGTDVPR